MRSKIPSAKYGHDTGEESAHRARPTPRSRKILLMILFVVLVTGATIVMNPAPPLPSPPTTKLPTTTTPPTTALPTLTTPPTTAQPTSAMPPTTAEPTSTTARVPALIEIRKTFVSGAEDVWGCVALNADSFSESRRIELAEQMRRVALSKSGAVPSIVMSPSTSAQQRAFVALPNASRRTTKVEVCELVPKGTIQATSACGAKTAPMSVLAGLINNPSPPPCSDLCDSFRTPEERHGTASVLALISDAEVRTLLSDAGLEKGQLSSKVEEELQEHRATPEHASMKAAVNVARECIFAGPAVGESSKPQSERRSFQIKDFISVPSFTITPLLDQSQIVLYGAGDIVSGAIMTYGYWDRSKVFEQLKSLRRIRDKVRLAASILEAREAGAAVGTAVNVSDSFAVKGVEDDPYGADDVRYFDIGGNVGSLLIPIWMRNYTTDAFEALPQNQKLLALSQCVNEATVRARGGTMRRFMHHAMALGDAPANKTDDSGADGSGYCSLGSYRGNLGNAYMNCTPSRVSEIVLRLRNHIDKIEAKAASASGSGIADCDTVRQEMVLHPAVVPPGYGLRALVRVRTLDEEVAEMNLENVAMRRRFASLFAEYEADAEKAAQMLLWSPDAINVLTPTAQLLGFISHTHIVTKIDVEGFDPYIFAGASALLGNPHTRPRIMSCELWYHADFEKYYAYMKSNGYLLYHPRRKFITTRPEELQVSEHATTGSAVVEVWWVDERFARFFF